MVENNTVTESLLGSAPDFALRAGDVVEGFVFSVYPNRVERLQNPIVQECVAVGKRHALDEFSGSVKRVGDGVTRLNEHRSTTADTTMDSDVSGCRFFRVDLVSNRLKRPNDDGRFGPLPHAKCRAAPTSAEFFSEHLVECHVLGSGHGHRRKVIPRILRERACVRDCPANCRGHRLGVEPQHHDIGGKRVPHSASDLPGVGRDGDSFDSRGDAFQGFVRFEEEITRNLHRDQRAVAFLCLDDNKLSAGNFVFAFHP